MKSVHWHAFAEGYSSDVCIVRRVVRVSSESKGHGQVDARMEPLYVCVHCCQGILRTNQCSSCTFVWNQVAGIFDITIRIYSMDVTAHLIVIRITHSTSHLLTSLICGTPNPNNRHFRVVVSVQARRRSLVTVDVTKSEAKERRRFFVFHFGIGQQRMLPQSGREGYQGHHQHGSVVMS